MMQDRLRIRVWDKRKNKYIKNFVVNFINKSPYMTVEYFDNKYAYIHTFEEDEIIIEQCVGLKDKNSRLIYEGDIIKQRNSIYKIIFSYDDVASCGCCIEEFSGCGFVMEDNYGSRGRLDIDSELEIIGNIHKNPDLLENE